MSVASKHRYMREVEVTADLEAPRAEVEERLSPKSIVEHAGTYAVRSVERRSDGRTVLAVEGEKIEAVLEFEETEDGYVYSQRGNEGPFEEMTTWVTVSEDGETRVTVRSAFTFGGTFSFLTDRLGTRIRRDELERMLVGLASEFERERDEGTESGE